MLNVECRMLNAGKCCVIVMYVKIALEKNFAYTRRALGKTFQGYISGRGGTAIKSSLYLPQSGTLFLRPPTPRLQRLKEAKCMWSEKTLNIFAIVTQIN